MPNLTIENVRISYPKLFQAEQINGQGDPKFSAAFLIPETHPKLHELFKIAEEVVNAEYPDGKRPHNFKPLPCYRATDNPKYAGKPEYNGIWVLNSSKNSKQGAPVVVDQQMNRVLDQSLIYPGLYVNVAVSIYSYSHPTSKGVTTGLEAVQIVRDGDRLDNRPSVDELFQPIDVPESGPAASGGPTMGGPVPFNPLD